MPTWLTPNRIVTLVISVAILVSSLSLFRPTLFYVHDITQGARVAEMWRGLMDGQFPVRWSKNFGFGYGMPTFLFYAPLIYYIGALIYGPTGNLDLALKALWFLPSVIAAAGAYFFLKPHLGRGGAVVAAVAFTLAPYRAVDLYVRGALSESWGIALIPWMFWAADQMLAKREKRFGVFSLMTAAMLVTHNLLALMTLPLVGLYAVSRVFLFSKKDKLRLLVQTIGESLLGLMLAAWYVFPALGEKNHTQIDTRIFSDYFNYELHFLSIKQFFQENWKYGGSTWGPNDDISFFLGYGQLLALAVLFALVVWKIFQMRKLKLSIFFTRFKRQFHLILFGGALLLSLFMTHSRSHLIWDNIGILASFQFPWRFLSLAIFCLSVLCGIAVRYFPNRWRIYFGGAIVLIMIIPSFKYFQPVSFLQNSEEYYYDDETRIQKEMSLTWPDFLPIAFQPPIMGSPIISGEGGEDIIHSFTSRQLSATTTTLSTPISLHIANFPGWKVTLDGQDWPHQTDASGLISVTPPAPSTYEIRAELRRTQLQLISDIISIGSIAAIVFIKILLAKSRS